MVAGASAEAPVGPGMCRVCRKEPCWWEPQASADSHTLTLRHACPMPRRNREQEMPSLQETGKDPLVAPDFPSVVQAKSEAQLGGICSVWTVSRLTQQSSASDLEEPSIAENPVPHPRRPLLVSCSQSHGATRCLQPPSEGSSYGDRSALWTSGALTFLTGWPPEEALRWGGSVAGTTSGPCHCGPAHRSQLSPQCVEKLNENQFAGL